MSVSNSAVFSFKGTRIKVQLVNFSLGVLIFFYHSLYYLLGLVERARVLVKYISVAACHLETLQRLDLA